MKKILTITILVAGLAQGSWLWAQQAFDVPLRDAVKIEQTQLPAAVQQTLLQQMGPVRVEDIDRGTLEGKTVYEIGFKREGVHTEVRIAEDGTFLGMSQLDGQGAPAQPQPVIRQAPQQADVRPTEQRPAFHWYLQGGQKVSLQQAPAPVQQTLAREAGQVQLHDVVRGGWADITAYQISFKENGRQTEMRISEDGKFLESRSYEKWSPLAQHLERARKVDNLLTLPGPVLETLREEAGRNPVDSVIEGREGREEVYKFSFREPDRRIVLKTAKDGRILDRYEHALEVGFGTQLNESQPLQFQQAPEPVQRVLRDLAGRRQVDRLELGQISDQMIYQAVFQMAGKIHTVRLTPDGFIIQEAQQTPR